MNKKDSFIYNTIQTFRSETSLSIFNFLTNNSDIINICPNLFLGNIKSVKNSKILEKYDIDCIVNCSKDIPFNDYFKDKKMFRIDIEDNKETENLDLFKQNIINAVSFIHENIELNKNVIVHCYWGLMRSPTVIASYLIFKYKMDVECAIEFIKDKKNFSFHNIYNFKEILYFVKKEFEDKNFKI